MKNNFLRFSILFLTCCNIYSSYGNNDNNDSDISENILCYIITTNNYSFVSTKEVNMTQEYLQNLGIEENYKTLIIVFDDRLQTTICAQGFYEKKFLDSTELRKIADELIQKHKTRPEVFDNILGLQWGMRLEDAIHKLQEIGLYSWTQASDTQIMYVQNIAWNGVLYGAVELSYIISNKQNKYLDGIIFLKLCDNAEQTKSLGENIVSSLMFKYGKEAIRINTDQTNRLIKYYEVYGSIFDMELPITMARIKLAFGYDGVNGHGITLWYNGMLQAQEKVEADNNL